MSTRVLPPTGKQRAGLARGAYHFFHPAIPVTAQAELFGRTVAKLEPGDLPPVLDLEAPEEWQGIPVLNRTPLVLKWLQGVEKHLQRRPMIYVSPAFMTEIMHNASALAQYPVWLAHYTTDGAPAVPKPWATWTFWQHTRQGTLPGVMSRVDLNCFNGSLEELRALTADTASSEIAPV
jgi:lysozyme